MKLVMKCIYGHDDECSYAVVELDAGAVGAIQTYRAALVVLQCSGPDIRALEIDADVEFYTAEDAALEALFAGSKAKHLFVADDFEPDTEATGTDGERMHVTVKHVSWTANTYDSDVMVRSVSVPHGDFARAAARPTRP